MNALQTGLNGGFVALWKRHKSFLSNIFNIGRSKHWMDSFISVVGLY